MSCLYISRIKIPGNEIIADIMFKLYQNSAHELPFIYNYRTWILNYSSSSKDGQALNMVKKMSEQLSA